VVSEVRVRVLNYIALVAVHIAIVRVVIVVVIVVGVVVLVRVLDAVGVRMDVQMRWLGCVVATRHKNRNCSTADIGSVFGWRPWSSLLCPPNSEAWPTRANGRMAQAAAR
jgi:hypothetical protein